MDTDQRLSGALQENILTLLCFNDSAAKLIRHTITPRLFESAVFKEVATHAIDFIDQFGSAIKEHLPDSLEHILKGDDKRKATSYQKLVDNLFASSEAVNVEYVLAQLNAFVRQQTFKSALVEAVGLIDEGNIDAAEVAMQRGLSAQAVSFESGTNFSDPAQMMGLTDDSEEEGFDLGIPELDQAGVIPRRKELMMLIAPRGRGKSWFMTHAMKMATLQRWRSVVISLEMSEKRYGARFLQSFFALSTRDAQVKMTRLVKDRDGYLQDVMQEQIEAMVLKSPEAAKHLAQRVSRRFARRPPLWIKQFPTKACTLSMIEAYLDGLERFHGFVPDCIGIDYPDLMQHDIKNKRLELGEIIEGIRGLGVKRNAAMIALSQPNAEGERATTITGNMASEDISKLATVDVMLTLNQTLAEKKLGLARIWVDKARNNKDKFATLITQAYDIGQFCTDSCRMSDDYWDYLQDSGSRRSGG